MDLLAEMRGYARANYWTDSWDALLRWNDQQLSAAIAGAKTRRGAIAKAWQHIRQIDATRGHMQTVKVYGPKPVRPVSLFEYLASQGGLAPHPELTAVLDGNPFIGGYGPLVRRAGVPLDEARRMAVEGGYLFDTAWEAGEACSTVRELLDAISDEAHGRKVYVHGERGEDPAEFCDEEEMFDDDEIPF